MRTLPAAELARILDGSGDWEFWVEIERATDPGWIELTDISGRDYVLAISLGNESPDQPVSTFSVRFVMKDSGEAVSPGDQTSPLNLDSGGAYDPLIYPGNRIRIDAANLAAGETRATATERRWLEGEIEAVDWPGDEVACECSTPDGRLFATQIEEEEVRGAVDPGVPVEEEIQGLADRWMEDPPTLYVEGTPDWNVGEYTPSGSVGEQARALAQQQGWDLRYKWQDATGAFEWTLYLPPRDKVVPDLTIGPDEITEIPGLKVSREYVRTDFTGEYTDATTGKRATRTLSLPAARAQFGKRWMGITEGDESSITSAAQMDALLAYAAHDLGDVHTEKRVRVPFFPWLELHDLIRITPDGVHLSGTLDFAVVGVSHEVSAEGGASTVLELRGGSPVGMYFDWHLRPRPDEGPAYEFGFVDFREMEPAVPGNRRWGWTRRGRQVTEAWFAYDTVPAPWNEDYWPEVAALVVPIPDDQEWVEIPNADLPDASEIGALWVEPRIERGGSLVVHSEEVVERVKILPVPASLDVVLTAAIVDNAVDLSLMLTQAAGAKVYPATALVYEDGEAGTLIATIVFAADGTRTKAEVSALGGRTLPAEGKRTWFVAVTDVAGNRYTDSVDVTPIGQPRFEDVDTRLSPTDLRAVDLYGAVLDPQPAQGGTLEWWFPTIDTDADTVAPADPLGAVTGSRVVTAAEIADGSFNFDPTDPTDFSAIPTTGAETLTLFLKYTSDDDRTTGAQPFVLKGSLGRIFDLTNGWRAGSIDTALALAPDYRWFAFATAAELLGTTPADWKTDIAFDATEGVRQAYRYNEGTGKWDPFTPTATHAQIPILQAGIISTTLLQAEAVTGTIIAGDAVEARHLSAIEMEVGKYIESATYTAGSVGWRIDADGSAEFNDVTIRGMLDAVGGTFEGELTAEVVEVAGGLFLSGEAGAAAAMIKWGNGLPGSTARLKPADGSFAGSPPHFTLDLLNLSSTWDTKFDFDMNNGGLTLDGPLVVGGGAVREDVDINGDLEHDGSAIGFFATPVAGKQTVTGSRAGNAALASVLTALATYGLITNNSTA